MNLDSDHLKSAVSEQIGYESSFVSFFGAFFFFVFFFSYLQIAWLSLCWERSQLLGGGGRCYCVCCCGLDLACLGHGHFIAVLLHLYSSEVL